jgi:DNA-binding LacI/PurR family transcriptional regulator
MGTVAGDSGRREGSSATETTSAKGAKPTKGVGSPTPTIYDVARVAGVATSTVSRALSNPGRVSFKTAEHIRKVARELGYRSQSFERDISEKRTMILAMIVADINNPVFHGMVRGAERTAAHLGYTVLVVETQESEAAERAAIQRVRPSVDGIILASPRIPDSVIRTAAKQRPLVVMNRVVDQVVSVANDNVGAIRQAIAHLADGGVRTVTYLAGPQSSWADGMRWRGVLEAGHKLKLRVCRIGPCDPTMVGGVLAAKKWQKDPTHGVIAYNDLIAIGFLRMVLRAGQRVPEDVQVIGFDNILDAALLEPRLTTIASPVVSLGSAAVRHLLWSLRSRASDQVAPVLLPARLIIRDTTGRRTS